MKFFSKILINLKELDIEQNCLPFLSDYSKSSFIKLFDIEIMDLPYPTMKYSKEGNDLNQLDRLARSILLSTHNIPKQDSISKSLKSKILKTITSDNARKLHQVLQKNVISFDVQIGTRGSRWNILHFCAKNNAHQCIQYILKTQYQEYEGEYKQLLNCKTVEGYSVLVIAIINRSHRVLQKILEFGGVDIHILDQHKMSPYQIALNYKNDKAIRLLMNYESKTKKKQFINKQLLNTPINFPKLTCCQEMVSCLLGCLTFGFYDHDDGFQMKDENKIKVSDYIIQEECIDYVAINSKKQLKGYDIEWKRASEIMIGKITVFDSYNPFEILQTNFTIKNNLIIFQCLSQQPWLIRRTLKSDRCRNNSYNVFLYPNKMLEKQNIDDYIPYIKDRKQAMFLSNQQQMWPMLLQKALAKSHHSYFALAEVSPRDLLEQITGFPTVNINLSQIENDKIISFFQQVSTRNYPFMLRGKKGTDLCEQQGKEQCFTILNFYQKNSQELILINCPFISQVWKQKQKHEPLALKLIKGHYNTHKQMCVWIDARKIKDYFESVIISLSFINYQRTELKIKTKQLVFFKFRIENRKQENVYFQLSNTKNQQVYNLQNLQIIRNQGKQLLSPIQTDIKKLDPTLAQIQCLAGQYMCCFEIEQSQEIQSLLLLCWSAETIQPQFVESQLGILQWLGFLKNHFQKVEEQCVLEVLGDFSLVTLREKTVNTVLFRMNLDADLIIQGRKDQQTGFVEMISEGNVHYCVVKRVVKDQQIVFDYKKRQ